MHKKHNSKAEVLVCLLSGKLTLGADATQVSDLHQHAREHVGFVRSPAPCVDLQSLQQGFLQTIYTFGLFKVHSVYRKREDCKFRSCVNVPDDTTVSLQLSFVRDVIFNY